MVFPKFRLFTGFLISMLCSRIVSIWWMYKKLLFFIERETLLIRKANKKLKNRNKNLELNSNYTQKLFFASKITDMEPESQKDIAKKKLQALFINMQLFTFRKLCLSSWKDMSWASSITKLCTRVGLNLKKSHTTCLIFQIFSLLSFTTYSQESFTLFFR